MAFVVGMNILQGPTGLSDKIHKADFPEKLGLAIKSEIHTASSIIGQEPRRCSESKFPVIRSGIGPGTSPEPLQIFVLGPSIFGKGRLIECAAGQNLGIPTQKNIYRAYSYSGLLLQGVEVEINLLHVGSIYRSLDILREFYLKYKTCFMMVYDVNDSTTFDDVQIWIQSLQSLLGISVPIVLVGYEDYEETLTSKLAPVSFSNGIEAKERFGLKTFYEFSDMTGPAVCELIFDAAHIALESKEMTPDSALGESKEKNDDSYNLSQA